MPSHTSEYNTSTKGYYTLTSVLTSKVGDYKAKGEELGTDAEEFSTDIEELGTDAEEFSTDIEELGTDAEEFSTDIEELGTDAEEFSTDTGKLPNDIKAAIDQLGRRPRRENLRPVIRAICDQGRWVTSAELAQLLNFHQNNLMSAHITPMMHSGELESRFPDKPNHPRQAYRAVVSQHPETS